MYVILYVNLTYIGASKQRLMNMNIEHEHTICPTK